MDGAKTLQQAILHFSDFENCKAVIVKLRWPNVKVTCPQCGSEHVFLAKARVWKCYGVAVRSSHSIPEQFSRIPLLVWTNGLRPRCSFLRALAWPSETVPRLGLLPSEENNAGLQFFERRSFRAPAARQRRLPHEPLSVLEA